MRMPPKHARQVLMKVIDLCSDPMPSDAEMLKGTKETFYRATSGEYRIIYRVVGDILEVALIEARNDDESYKKMKRKGL